MHIDPQISQDLHQQTEAAKTLLDHLRDLIGGDEDVAADIVEGQTDLHETMQKAVFLVTQDETHMEAIDEHIKKLKDRKERLAQRAKMTRVAIAVAMQVAAKKSFPTPIGTVSRKATPVSVEITNEAEIPSRFWVTGDPKLSKKDLLSALKDLKEGETIPGAKLSEPGETISIRV